MGPSKTVNVGLSFNKSERASTSRARLKKPRTEVPRENELKNRRPFCKVRIQEKTKPKQQGLCQAVYSRFPLYHCALAFSGVPMIEIGRSQEHAAEVGGGLVCNCAEDCFWILS